MLIQALLIVTFAASGANAPVDVYTDNNPNHWRKLTVTSQAGYNIDRTNRCRFRLDARRILKFGPDAKLSQYMPRKCMTKAERKMRPDPYPG